jgi:GST-like protein
VTQEKELEMIDLYFWTTPNGYKPLIMLEETGLEHRILPVNIALGEQFDPDFLEVSPNNRIPAIVDHDAQGHDGPLSIFESGAILQYLAEKTGRYLPTETGPRADVMQWLFWQMGGVGPMFGQFMHFAVFAPEHIAYGVERYRAEAERLLGVLDRRLAGRDHVAGAYSIADMAIYPWVRSVRERLAPFANVDRWVEAISARDAVARAYAAGAALNSAPGVTEEPKAQFAGIPETPAA